MIKTIKVEISFFFLRFFIYIIYIKFSISIWGHGTLRTDLFKSSISIYSPLFILRFRWEAWQSSAFCSLFCHQNEKKEAGAREYRLRSTFPFLALARERSKGDFPSKPLGNAGSAARCQQSAISFTR